jgi:hypothetical protein
MDIANLTEKELDEIDPNKYNINDLRLILKLSQRRIKKLEQQQLKDKSELLALRKIVEDFHNFQQKIENFNFYDFEKYLNNKIKS